MVFTNLVHILCITHLTTIVFEQAAVSVALALIFSMISVHFLLLILTAPHWKGTPVISAEHARSERQQRIGRQLCPVSPSELQNHVAVHHVRTNEAPSRASLGG